MNSNYKNLYVKQKDLKSIKSVSIHTMCHNSTYMYYKSQQSNILLPIFKVQ